MALIHQDNVVFYHPLDTKEEFTKNQDWPGNITFVPAKVVSGVVPVDILDVFSFDSGVLFDKAAASADRINMTSLSQDIALLHCGVYSVVIEISGTTIASGVKLNGLTTNEYTNAYKVSYANGSGYSLLTSYGTNASTRTVVNLVFISGTDLTSIETQRFNPTESINYAHVGLGVFDDGQHALMVDSNSQQAVILSISGGGFTSGLTQLVAPTSVAHDIAPINNSGSLIIFTTGKAYIANCDFDNDIITFGSGYTFSSVLATHHPTNHTWTSRTLYLGDDKVLLVYQRIGSFNFNPSYGIIAQISGTTITYGDEVNLSLGSSSVGNDWGTTFIELSQLSSGNVMYSYAHRLDDGDSYFKYRVLTVSGVTINASSERIWGKINQGLNNLKTMSPSSVLGVYKNVADDIVVHLGVLDQEIDITISGVDYPSTSGHDHIAVAMWIKNPFPSGKSEEILTKFGYHMRIRPSAILLSDDTGYDFVGSLSGGFMPNGNDIDHEGHSGEDSDFISINVSGFLDNNNADIILLHIGTNDIAAAIPVADIRDSISGICSKIWQWGVINDIDTRIILAKITNWSDPSSSGGLAVTELNGLLQTLGDDLFAAGNKISTVDMENALIYPDDLEDNVHPNVGGYSKMAYIWYPNLISGMQDIRQSDCQSTINVMPLGDSITHGFTHVNSYRRTLQTLLLTSGLWGANWDGSGIQNVIDEINDNFDHFLIMDFRNISDEWTLKTSLDGVGWINQGAPTTGSQKILCVSGIAPGLSVS